MRGNMGRISIIAAVLLVMVWTGIYGQSVWEGNAAVSRYGELPSTGFFAASNTFPTNTLVTVRIEATGKNVTVYVISALSDPGLFLLLSPQAAQELGVEKGTVVPVRAMKAAAGAQPGLENRNSPGAAVADIRPIERPAGSAAPVSQGAKSEGRSLLDSIREELRTKSSPAQGAPAVGSAGAGTRTASVPDVPRTETTGQNQELPLILAAPDTAPALPERGIPSVPDTARSVAAPPVPPITGTPEVPAARVPLTEFSVPDRTAAAVSRPETPLQDRSGLTPPVPSPTVPVQLPPARTTGTGASITPSIQEYSLPETSIVKTEIPQPVTGIPPSLPSPEVTDHPPAPASSLREKPLPAPVPGTAGTPRTAPAGASVSAAPDPMVADTLSFDGIPAPKAASSPALSPAVPRVSIRPSTIETDLSAKAPVTTEPAVRVTMPEVRDRPAPETVQPSLSSAVPAKPGLPADAAITLEPAEPRPPVASTPEAAPSAPVPAGGPTAAGAPGAAAPAVPVPVESTVVLVPAAETSPEIRLPKENGSVVVLPPKSDVVPAPGAGKSSVAGIVQEKEVPETSVLVVPVPSSTAGLAAAPQPTPVRPLPGEKGKTTPMAARPEKEPVKTASVQPAKEAVKPAAAIPEKVSAAAPAGNTAKESIRLEKGQSYLQLGAYSTHEMAGKIAGSISSGFPTLIVAAGAEGQAVYRLYVGPIRDDESGLLLRTFKSRGFKDAYLKKGE